MTYVAWLRVRRVLLRYGIFLGILFALAIVSIATALAGSHGHHANMLIYQHKSHTEDIGFGWILAGAITAAYLIVPALGANLDAEYRAAAIAFTRPISRYVLAAQYFAVDAAGLAIAAVMGLVIALSVVGALGGFPYVTFGPDTAVHVVLALCVAVMWYGWVLLAAALFPGRGNAMIGVSWAFALFVPGLALMPLPTLFHDIAVAITYLDPLAYLGSNGPESDNLLVFTSPGIRAAAALLIGVVAVAVGTRLWATREVTA
ncbi:MAG TPA: hypothetical protein VFB22_17845 [Candidatus Baltobacteraceae bacterium]|nr:hypothetical protein [Candidatus Baltobacteraceae bacterium]